MATNPSYGGTTAAYENGDGNGMGDDPTASSAHAWFIIIGALALLWFLGGVAFKTVRI